MHEFIQFFHQYPFAILGVKAVWSAFADAFPAPTEKSGPGYRFAFAFINLLAFNFARAKGTSIENSPNFVAAAEKYLAEKEAVKQRFAVVTDWQQPKPPTIEEKK